MSRASASESAGLIAITRRERQIMDVVYRHGSATAADIHRELEDPPTYTTVRGLLRVLVGKGQLRIERAGGRYVYSPVVPKGAAGETMISHVVRTFFAGSPSSALTALLGSADIDLSPEELQRLQEVIDDLERGKKAP
ncbi:MAG TPA: BlaI/MecI/CopY family transcriptional regulator [Allosphingosinicella sp.]|nr:BlaI/MecI/CopY family transcriptional regulator [Allosphingosinicella sp.]